MRTFFTTTAIACILFLSAGGSVHGQVPNTPSDDTGGILSGSATRAITKAGYGDQTETKLSTIVGRIVNAALSLLGTVFLVLIVYGGYKWMMSGGNEEDVTKAKALIWQAIIGLMIVLGALLITNFVLGQLAQATK